MPRERTFVMLKPGVLQRRIAGNIIGRLEAKGLKIMALKMIQLETATVETHYAEHKGKAFYPPLLDYMTRGPVIAMILEGEDAIGQVRTLCGSTDPNNAAPGSIRGDFAQKANRNIIHASDSPASSEREIALFFKPAEIFDWKDEHAGWINE